MATKYQSLQQEIAKLQEQAEAVRAEEVAGVIAKIKDAIDAYGLIPSDLFGRNIHASAKSRGTKPAGTVAYADGQGGEWGGRGPRPLWLRDAIAAGHSLEEFRVEGASSVSGKTTTASSKRAVRMTYKSPNGSETWSGFGRKPGWLNELLEAGYTLESLAA
jgi:DNA-binding protein H-NS